MWANVGGRSDGCIGGLYRDLDTLGIKEDMTVVTGQKLEEWRREVGMSGDLAGGREGEKERERKGSLKECVGVEREIEKNHHPV